jgi:CRP/FNR family transcriptional regulator, dissimilatory nitrate respiration regulator
MISIMSPELSLLFDRLRGSENVYRAGEAVFHLGDVVRRMYVVRSGTIHLVRHQRGGSAVILQRAGPGSILAEASLYSTRYHCDASAETDATTWSIARSELRRRIAEDPEFSEAWADHLAQEVQRARLHAEILSLKTVSERLDAWVAWSGAPPSKGRGAVVAMAIGVTPEALYREMAKRRS